MATVCAGERVKKWALIIDVARCTNCQNCVLATKDEHMGNDYPDYTAPMPSSGANWITVERHTRGNDTMLDVTYIPKTCNHCDDAPCVRAAADGAIRQRPDGIVIIDPVKAHERRDLVESCPYGSIVWNEEARVPQKWSFDAHLLDNGWKQPRCVQACPTRAMQSVLVADAELEELKERLGLAVLRPELHTRPRVLYQNLHSAMRCFLGGTVTRRTQDGSVENVPEARVELLLDGVARASCLTDSFGDFKFDDLPADQVPWVVQAGHAAHGTVRAEGKLAASRYLGALLLH